MSHFKKNRRAKDGIFLGCVGLSANLLLVGIKLYAGFMANSVSILADAMNSLGDSAAALLTIGGFYIASIPADREHPYGHERAEYISGLFTAIIILIVGLQFLMTSIRKILNPTRVVPSSLVLGLLILSMLIKAGLAFYYNKKNNSLPQKSNTIHALVKDSLYDILINFVIVFSYLIEIQFGWFIDGYVGAAVALLILHGGFTSIMDSSHDLMGTRPSPELIHDMQEVLDSYETLIGYHDLILHKYGPSKMFATVDIEVDSRWNLIRAHRLIDSIEKRFKEEFDIVLVCHLDPIALDDDEQNEIYKLIKKTLKSYDECFHFHDFRVEDTGEKKEIFFDVVVPDENDFSNEELYEKIVNDLFKELENDYLITIEFDRNYVLKE